MYLIHILLLNIFVLIVYACKSPNSTSETLSFFFIVLILVINLEPSMIVFFVKIYGWVLCKV